MGKINLNLANLVDIFEETIIYIALKSEKDPRFGAIKLNKILYYVDKTAYLNLGKTITGVEYQHLEEGPSPKALLPVRDQLLAEGAIQIEFRRYFSGIQQRIVAKRTPNISAFRKEEIEIIDEVIEILWSLNGQGVSNLSHEEFGWKVTNDFETIPMRTAWLSSEPLSMEQVELGQKIAESPGLTK